MAWIKSSERRPATGRKVHCRLKHALTGTIQEHRLKSVDEGDCSWRTADDGAELSHNWDVIEWLEPAAITHDAWTEERDGYTHTPSGHRVLPCGPCTFAVLKGGKQVRTESGRLRRWLDLDKARAFVEQSH